MPHGLCHSAAEARRAVIYRLQAAHLVSPTSLPLPKESHERMDVRFIRAYLNRTDAERLEELAAPLHCRGPPLRVRLAYGATGGVYHDVSASLQVLQRQEAETWQVEFTPICD